MEELYIGLKKGCITVIGGKEEYQREVVDFKVAELEEEKIKFLAGDKTKYTFSSIDEVDKWIEHHRQGMLYKCICKCGKISFLPERFILRKNHRNCGEDCGLLIEKERQLLASYPREKAVSYDYPLLNTYHDTLEIVECINDNFEGEPSVYHKGRRGAGVVPVYKLYRCKCFLCGKEYEYRSDKFNIYKPMYGPYAKFGYQCEALCECRQESGSSFQWRTIKILKEHDIPFRVEWSFEDLYGIGGVNRLRFDFAVFNVDGSIKCLIECQGLQHAEPVGKFGGRQQFEKQQANDELKRKYVKEHGYVLIEIPHQINTYDKEEEFLKKNNVIV